MIGSSKKDNKIPRHDFQTDFARLNSASVAGSDIYGQLINFASCNSSFYEIFTLEEIVQSLRRIRNKKSPSFDNIINAFLKNSPKSVLKLIVSLFNIILNTGRVPTQWYTGIILPLYKNKGSHDDPNNYRGITLLSCLGKLFTNIINNRLAQYLEDDNIL